MPAQQESDTTVLTWTLNTIADAREFQDAMFDLGLTCVLQRIPSAPAEKQLQLQVLLPDDRNGPVIVDSFGARVCTVTMAGALVTIARL